jgi:CO/xanthine dehydrogenase Mo-binding subunit
MSKGIKSGSGFESSASSFRVIGSQPISQDAVEKATGRAVYAFDIRLPRMIHGKILRSPHAHARILSIDTSRAEALPGVLAVVTWQDFWAPEEVECPSKVNLGLKQFRDNYMASDKVLYCGHPIAAVAALDSCLAEEALRLVDVKYEILPPVLDPLLAVEKTSPILHEGVSPDWLRGNDARRQNRPGKWLASKRQPAIRKATRSVSGK